MQALIAYDIVKDKPRTEVFKYLTGLGLHSQRSVFEIETDPAMLRTIVRTLSGLIDPDTDSVIIIPLCRRCAQKTLVSGQGVTLVRTDFLVI
ncbi:CRISPR-associated endonuclease Cas2 [Desulfolutivibrio sulfoxidireducens]|uniref:CRISPR-associated endonuclease Cas2 n=1 Tax=Desulfolutivibrio sulfoxidireducens TaxID=2773299 RepID=UPI00159DE0D6|nr:CRISPR-associated endonuclease Cas2 [Desulfolutivibrio sulfoxidireducens]QLA19339.1 CRISPR-associated endonuclease Cas2 [Desulfolutivibrio sulfoxidireducens]